MVGKTKRASPVLGAAMALIDQAGGTLVPKGSRFQHTFEVPVDRIRSDPGQARKVFADVEIAALAATMAEQGQLQPVLLRRDPDRRDAHILVAGERRWRAARLNGWESILAIEHDGDPEVASLIENLQRVGLTAVEEARGLQKLIEGKGWTQMQAAEALGKSKAEVSATLRILTLPETVLDGVLTSELDIPRSALVEIARIEDQEVLNQLVELARGGGLTIRAIRAARQPEAKQGGGTEGEGASQGDRDGSARDQSPRPKRFTFGTLDRVASGLKAVREAGRTIDANDRKRLEALRIEIDALLGSVGG